ncbi:RnfABCDGE type electron transport complex subunit D [Aminithiophilus ramosus]|uniref:Ion-translocating oxidoreductase complex subunit D n=2 Tax=Synergistales TaxID=649776 RepID=A0A9Q7AME9_9BACT|nr:RnfABCDGE type electron transport complex subunit D [Aminithiophilus ramosus]QTX32257.1 RnfABCDGE type electron transport complex subunit D [Aminithiophilus ramosus]QVL36125.1 RnfABCDGE type electron transport complex subunit D [Synergistota bacterium]
MSEKLVVSASPHVHANSSVRTVMGDVLIALVPALAAAVYFFGPRALILTAVTAASAVASEYLWQRLLGRTVTIGDGSAALTGVLLAFNVPPTFPLWMAAIGGAFAVVIVKQFFGGLGKNVVNPALAARAFLLASWPGAMTTWTVDGLSSATALGILKEGGQALPSMMDLFVGHVGGCLGETSTLALLVGAAWLLWRRVITPEIPVVYIATTALFTWILGRDGFFTGNALYEILSGGLFLGAIFMATDYVTSPMTVKGRAVFAFGCGLLTALIRLYGSYPEGVSFAILLMNLVTPLIDRGFGPRRFGEVTSRG